MPFDGLADQFMCADEDIYLACLEFGNQFLGLPGGFHTAELFNPHGEVLHALFEGVIVLQRQHGGRNQNGYLLAVCRYFECRAHSYFRLSEAHIAAYQSVHGHRTL